MNRLLAAVILVVLAVGVVSPALTGGYLWDDDEAVTGNVHLHSVEGLKTLWSDPSQIPQRHYWPMVYTTFWIEYQLWGLNPIGYHLVNALLHALATILVWVLFRRAGLRGGWIAAALFAVHPMHVESVAWIVERKDVLSACFYLGAALAYVQFDARRRERDYALALLLFAGGLLSKSMVVTFPVAVWLWLWWSRGRLVRRDLVRVAPFLLIGAAFALFDVNVSRSRVEVPDLAFLERLVLAGRIVWFYAAKLVWPAPLMAIYPRWTIEAGTLLAWVPTAALVTGIASLYVARRRIGRGPLFGVLFFVVTLAPLLGLVDYEYMVHSYVADRYAYLPSLGLLGLVGAGLAWIGARIPRPLYTSVAGAVILGLMLIGVRHAGDFRSLERLSRSNLAHNPEAFAAHNNLASVLFEQGDLEGAREHFEMALAIRPDYPYARNGLGTILARSGALEAATREYRAAIDAEPGYASAHNNLGIALLGLGRSEQAAEAFRKALRIQPGDPEILENLRQAELRTRAVTEAGQAAAAPDAGAETRYRLAVELLRAGRNAEAETALRQVLTTDPDHLNANRALAGVLVTAGRRTEALPYFEAVLRQDPDNVRFRLAFARTLAEAGDRTRAAEQFREVLGREPGNAAALAGLEAVTGPE